MLFKEMKAAQRVTLRAYELFEIQEQPGNPIMLALQHNNDSDKAPHTHGPWRTRNIIPFPVTKYIYIYVYFKEKPISYQRKTNILPKSVSGPIAAAKQSFSPPRS
jgi:hypothetical protein